jgi:hypothetical protein
MSPKFDVGDQVLVPAARLAQPDQAPYALVARRVTALRDRSVQVDDGAGGSVVIASRLVHPSSLGFSIIRIGDLTSEPTLLDPLAKSVLQFLRLLVPDNDLRSVSLRTLAELDAHWLSYHGSTSHVILIAHGCATSVTFVGDGAVSGGDLAERLRALAPQSRPKTFISLACATGRVDFARPFSQNAICRDLLAPFQSVHGAAASQYCQTLLTEHLLGGREIPYAHARAVKGVASGGRFRRWRDGVHCAAEPSADGANAN